MAFILPAAPNAGDTFTSPTNDVYVWDGQTWVGPQAGALPISPADFVLRAGDTMLGSLFLAGAPTAEFEAANKGYVDGELNAKVSLSGDTMTGNLVLDSGGGTTTVIAAGNAGISVTTGANTSVLTSQILTITGAAGSTDVTDGVVEIRDGGGLPRIPTADSEATTKKYVDDEILAAPFVKSVNGTLPDAAGNVAIALAGVTTGTLAARPVATVAGEGNVYIVSGDPTPENNGKAYINTAAGTWEEISGMDIAQSDSRYVNIAGDTMSGPLVLATDPVANLEAATKQYVDATTGSVTYQLNTFVAPASANIGDVVFVTTDGASTGTILQKFVYDGTLWFEFSVGAVNLRDIKDVTSPAVPIANSVLQFDGSNWVPAVPINYATEIVLDAYRSGSITFAGSASYPETYIEYNNVITANCRGGADTWLNTTTGAVTIGQPGRYLVIASADTYITNGERGFQIKVNGVVVAIYSIQSLMINQSITKELNLVAGDVVRISSIGSTATTRPQDSTKSYLQIRRVGL